MKEDFEIGIGRGKNLFITVTIPAFIGASSFRVKSHYLHVDVTSLGGTVNMSLIFVFLPKCCHSISHAIANLASRDK